MTTAPFRFSAQVDASGQFVYGMIADQALFVDPITDKTTSTGVVVREWAITHVDEPELFAALNAVVEKSDSRITKAREDYALKAAAVEADTRDVR